MSTILQLAPQNVWKHFYSLTQIPRPSGHIEKVTEFLVNFGKGLGLESFVDEIGNVMMLIWFVTIGCGCDIAPIIKYGALTLVFFAIAFVVMSLITFTVGRFFKISMEEIMACIIAAIGGPPTAAALAISNGWNALIVPGMLVGIYGYIIGNYFGVFVGNMLGGM